MTNSTILPISAEKNSGEIRYSVKWELNIQYRNIVLS